MDTGRKEWDYSELRDQFSAVEWQRIQTSQNRSREFYYFWCLKEAYIKAVGSGLSIEPQRVCFVHESCEPVSDGVVSETIKVELDGQVQPGWLFLPFQLDCTHVGCIAKGPLQAAVDTHHVPSSDGLAAAVARDQVAFFKVLPGNWPRVVPLE